MQRYHKVENLFKRENGKLIEEEFQEKHVELLKNNQWIFSEKIDGVNIRLHWSGEEMTILGRNNNSQIPPHLLAYLETLFKQEEIAKHVYPGCILVGEGYGERIEEPRGSQYKADGVGFALFDVVAMDGKYCDRHVVEMIAKNLNLEVTPLILEGTLQEAIDFIQTQPTSKFRDTAPMEGLIGTPVGDFLTGSGARIITKLRAEDYPLKASE